MILNTIKRFKHTPVTAMAILLFSAIISVIICTLQASNEAELRNYEETWKSVPITVTVTEPSGINSDMFLINAWVVDLFTGNESLNFYDVSDAENFMEATNLKSDATPIEFSLAEYVKDVQVKMSHWIETINGNDYQRPHLVGLTSRSCEPTLLPEYGCEITWYDGYDESIFAGEEPVCIIPEGMYEDYDNEKGETVLHFSAKSETPSIVYVNGKKEIVREKTEYQCTLKIVGTYTAGDEKSIYCPYQTIEQVYSELGAIRNYLSFSVTLADNNRLEEFRKKMSFCFLTPQANAEKVHWGFWINNGYAEFYNYALDINDENLFDLSAILEDSIEFNRKVTLIVVALSAVSGFLVGFLMIRRRKREIMLMRMVGESNFRVYCGFAIEQMLCIILGIALGGAYYKWNPINNLAIFAVTYFVALTLALVIFMSKKLIRNVKEDE